MKRAAMILAGILLLAGCASPGDGYSDETAQSLQQRVLAVTEAAVAADYPAARLRIDELRAAADDALARGELTEERHQSISSALDLVQADIDAAIAEQQRLAEEERQRLLEEQQRLEDQKDEDDERGKGKDNSGNDD